MRRPLRRPLQYETIFIYIVSTFENIVGDKFGVGFRAHHRGLKKKKKKKMQLHDAVNRKFRSARINYAHK